MTVRTGDVVFADEDGIVVIPAYLVEEMTNRSLKKVGGEDAARAAIRAGTLVREAFDRYRVL